jgi:hypothetical protein
VRERWRHVIDVHAFVIGKSIVFNSLADFEDAAVQAHELEHVRQRELVGPLFPVIYFICDVVFGYDHNPFEVKARQAAQR